MILAFPYHDPTGKFNTIFQNHFVDLHRLFSKIYISVTPWTKDQNSAFLKTLEKSCFHLYFNKPGTTIGDHYRGALKSITFQRDKTEKIYFGFIDRILYALEKHKNIFLKDIGLKTKNGLFIFERSEKAWKTHPLNYYYAEHMVIETLYKLLGRKIDLNFCGLLMDKNSAEKILEASRMDSFNVAGEWILIALLNKIQVEAKKVDWLSWEDPYWEGIKSYKLKLQRERDPNETYKRILSAVEFLMLLKVPGFKPLFTDLQKT